MNKKITAKFISSVGILSGISTVLMFIFEFPIPLMPPFLQLDFSNLPALIGGFAYGPLTGVIIVLIKAMLHLIKTSTGGVGELADFLTGASMVFVSSFIYKRFKTKKGAIASLGAGTCALAAVAAPVNYFILIPFYSNIMPMEAIFKACGEINPLIRDIATYVLYGAVPFNIIKGLILSVITFLIYKKISKVLH